ncbi:hypothetical protein N307_05328 [Dryobates pubescens]|uniref:Uncharacterized protein n=1 Tax=Dryobates pubescens TaxID=118200 RepID=A0A093J583_DRYPU|nr:hypothetical protein N307_05328 [Dryobates pubescens]
MSAPALQHAAQSLSPLPEHHLSHSSRDIRYIFLDGCKNISASHTLHGAGSPEQALGSGHVLASKKRLPVFQQLCEEAVPGVALGAVHLQSSSRELKQLPGAKVPREGTTGWMVRLAAGCSPCNKA